ncbi:MAG: Rieske 2Fe-2S domain-containing protein, partial [Myxococcales bacterium]|nr:Rieske 2Fe-2S domain-containing protein [Myxococcales bacterium]
GECPHLGCQISMDNQDEFICPCHATTFGLDGTVKEGPSPRGLDSLEARIVDDTLEVKFCRFQPQTEQKIKIG